MYKPNLPGKECAHANCRSTCHVKSYAKKKKPLNRFKIEKSEIFPKSDAADLERWFVDRHKELTGKCAHCGGRTCKGDPKYWKFSIAHILAKALFPSVKTHPLNYIELCFWGKSCHTNYDHLTLDMMELNCFDIVIERFIAMYPSIAENEKRRIPTILMEYVKDNT